MHKYNTCQVYPFRLINRRFITHPTMTGALTGKYTPENPPTGPRGRIYTPEFLTKVRPV